LRLPFSINRTLLASTKFSQGNLQGGFPAQVAKGDVPLYPRWGTLLVFPLWQGQLT